MTFARNLAEARERRAAERAANLQSLATTPAYRTGSYGPAAMSARPKEKTPRDEKYRRAVAALACIHCGKPGPSQAAHPNTGKGMGIKASDHECFPLCPQCHAAFDQGALFSKQARREVEKRWAQATRLMLDQLNATAK